MSTTASGVPADFLYERMEFPEVGFAPKMAAVASAYGFQAVQDGGQLWLRDPARQAGVAMPILMNPKWIFRQGDSVPKGLLAPYLASQFVPAQKRFVQSWERCCALVDSFPSESNRMVAVQRLREGILFVDPDQLEALLEQHAFPAFFAKYPSGRVVVSTLEYQFERRYAFIRAGYAASVVGESGLKAGAGNAGLAMLRHWHSTNSLDRPRQLEALMSVMFYPQVPLISTGPIGTRVVFLMDPPEQVVPPDAPTSWLDLTPIRRFGMEAHDHAAVLLDPDGEEATKTRHRRLMSSASFSGEQLAVLLEWLYSAGSSLAFHETDPCEFARGGPVDFALAFEHGLTIDRVFRRAISCIAADDPTERVFNTFEMADLLEVLRGTWVRTNPTDWFKTLFNPSDGLAVVTRCLSKMPSPFDAYFIDLATKVYGELKAVVMASVWDPARVQGDDVLVRKADLMTDERKPADKFVADVVRSLRNTHHGYVAGGDDKRFRRYLAMIDGNLPDSVSNLGVLWILSLLASPGDLIGWTPKPVGTQPR